MLMMLSSAVLRQKQFPFSAGAVWVVFQSRSECLRVPSQFSTALMPLLLQRQPSVLQLHSLGAQEGQLPLWREMVLRRNLTGSWKKHMGLNSRGCGHIRGALAQEEFLKMLLREIDMKRFMTLCEIKFLCSMNSRKEVAQFRWVADRLRENWWSNLLYIS